MNRLVPTNEDKQLLRDQLEKLLETYTGGDIKLTPFKSEKVTVYITAGAYLKMFSLISKYDKELAWHGIATRMDDNYLISDILVYPQLVAATTVESDDDAYVKWLMNLPDDTINNLKFQGHSHVNMGVTPSGPDLINWEKFLNACDDFYLLCIANKKSEIRWEIYDKVNNMHYDNKDVNCVVIDEAGTVIKDWADEEIKHKLKQKSFCNNVISSYPKSPYSYIQTSNTTKPKTNDISQYEDFIEYDEAADMYYAYEDLPGFNYSYKECCYVMSGARYRTTYGRTKPDNAQTKQKEKRKPGRPKKGDKD